MDGNQIQEERLEEIIAFECNAADLPCPRNADGITFAALDPWIINGTGLDSRDVECMGMNKPACGFSQLIRESPAAVRVVKSPPRGESTTSRSKLEISFFAERRSAT